MDFMYTGKVSRYFLKQVLFSFFSLDTWHVLISPVDYPHKFYLFW
jgi:hypothetical protein